MARIASGRELRVYGRRGALVGLQLPAGCAFGPNLLRSLVDKIYVL